MDVYYDEIAKVAYELYAKNGYIQGRDLDHWLEAERIVMARFAGEQQKTERKTETKTKKTAKKKKK